MNDCSRICVTPTRNEAWIIDKFTAAAGTWADHIIVADQGSTDGTVEKAEKAKKVQVVLNESSTFDEVHRQRLLIDKARQVPGRRILIALDADEALASTGGASEDWDRISAAKPGTVLRFRWINILPGYEKAWVSPQPLFCGFVDDGSEHSGKQQIHNPRLPCPENAPVLDLQNIVVLHFQYVLWERMRSKQRWYQAWEHMNFPQKGPLQIFRHYNHMRGAWKEEEIQPFNREWLRVYDREGIDFRSLCSEPVTWWDKEVAQMLATYNTDHFRRIDIWDINWGNVANAIGLKRADFSDPRSNWEKTVHRLLGATQKNRAAWSTRAFERLLRLTGW